jgi:hypothetical protein
MHVQDLGQRAGGHPRREAHNPQHQSLRTRDAKLPTHPLRGLLELVDQRPEHPHELQHGIELEPGGGVDRDELGRPQVLSFATESV